MKELSLNILDISQNSISAGATEIKISLIEEGALLTLTVEDNGCGMSRETVERVMDPFYTTRTTRKVGMGIPLLRLAAEQTGGTLFIESVTAEENPLSHGTVVRATFYTDSIDFTPVGDMPSTMCVMIQGHPEIDYVFRHKTPILNVELDTVQIKEILGDGISLAEPEIIAWLSEYLIQQYE
ncbi:MAG: sensor histidine kinase [Clostridia bacterium]|nr:sensor histidine kinase [Clostridia bacterium]